MTVADSGRLQCSFEMTGLGNDQVKDPEWRTVYILEKAAQTAGKNQNTFCGSVSIACHIFAFAFAVW